MSRVILAGVLILLGIQAWAHDPVLYCKGPGVSKLILDLEHYYAVLSPSSPKISLLKTLSTTPHHDLFFGSPGLGEGVVTFLVPETINKTVDSIVAVPMYWNHWNGSGETHPSEFVTLSCVSRIL